MITVHCLCKDSTVSYGVYHLTPLRKYTNIILNIIHHNNNNNNNMHPKRTRSFSKDGEGNLVVILV